LVIFFRHHVTTLRRAKKNRRFTKKQSGDVRIPTWSMRGDKGQLRITIRLKVNYSDSAAACEIQNHFIDTNFKSWGPTAQPVLLLFRPPLIKINLRFKVAFQAKHIRP
jgi:hypothetical protein